MAASPLVGVAVGAASSVAGIASKNKQAKAQQQQLDAQATNIRDQQILSEYQIKEQRRQVDAMAERERLLGLQQQTLGLAANEMQAQQQRIAQTQAQVAQDQAVFMNNQRAVAKQAAANMQAAETMKQLQQLTQRSSAEGTKTEQEANAIQAQRMLLQGAGSADTQAGQALLERIMNAVASGSINNTSVFNSEMDDAQAQLAYEQAMSELEFKLGTVGASQQGYNLSAAEQLNEIQRVGNTNNINTQTGRNQNALDYATASKRAQLNLASASNKTQSKAALSGVEAQRSSIQGASFADYLGAAGNLGMSLYQSGLFRGGASTPAASPQAYSIMSNTRLPAYQGGFNDGILSGQLRLGTSGFGVEPPYPPSWNMPGANDMMGFRGIG